MTSSVRGLDSTLAWGNEAEGERGATTPVDVSIAEEWGRRRRPGRYCTREEEEEKGEGDNDGGPVKASGTRGRKMDQVGPHGDGRTPAAIGLCSRRW